MRWAFALALVVLVGAAAAPASQPPTPGAQVAGASLGLFATHPDYDYAHLLDELVARGATDVLLVDVLVQQDVRSSSLSRRPGRSASLATLDRTMRQARERGLRVGWMPIVAMEARAAGEWRGVLDPGEERAAWFASYAGHVLEGASLAEAHGASRVVVGSELTSLQPFEGAWRTLIADVRAVFPGRVTYAANWDAYESVRFWDATDEIGVSAYFPVASSIGGRPSRREAAAALGAPLRSLAAFGVARSRPVTLLEVGFPAHADAAVTPWDETRDAGVDPALQATLLGAFCDARDEVSLAGFYVWNWFGHGGPRDPGYSLRGKPAAQVFEVCMRDEVARDRERR